jgi:hypothetical protein
VTPVGGRGRGVATRRLGSARGLGSAGAATRPAEVAGAGRVSAAADGCRTAGRALAAAARAPTDVGAGARLDAVVGGCGWLRCGVVVAIQTPTASSTTSSRTTARVVGGRRVRPEGRVRITAQ